MTRPLHRLEVLLDREKNQFFAAAVLEVPILSADRGLGARTTMRYPVYALSGQAAWGVAEATLAAINRGTSFDGIASTIARVGRAAWEGAPDGRSPPETVEIAAGYAVRVCRAATEQLPRSSRVDRIMWPDGYEHLHVVQGALVGVGGNTSGELPPPPPGAGGMVQQRQPVPPPPVEEPAPYSDDDAAFLARLRRR